MPALKGLDTTMERTRHAQALKAQGCDFALRYYSCNAVKNLSQSTAFAGSRQYAEQKRYDIIPLLPMRMPGAAGIVLDIDPDATHPDRDGGLFTV